MASGSRWMVRAVWFWKEKNPHENTEKQFNHTPATYRHYCSGLYGSVCDHAVGYHGSLADVRIDLRPGPGPHYSGGKEGAYHQPIGKITRRRESHCQPAGPKTGRTRPGDPDGSRHRQAPDP